MRAEKSTRPWCERRLGLAAEARTCPPRLCLGSKFARCLMHSAFGEFFVKTSRNYSAGSACVWPTMVFGAAYLRDNSALPYRSAQTRLPQEK